MSVGSIPTAPFASFWCFFFFMYKRIHISIPFYPIPFHLFHFIYSIPFPIPTINYPHPTNHSLIIVFFVELNATLSFVLPFYASLSPKPLYRLIVHPIFRIGNGSIVGQRTLTFRELLWVRIPPFASFWCFLFLFRGV